MSNPWFRLYSEFSHDPKVQMMSEAMQRRYIMLMCLRCADSLVNVTDEEVAFALRLDEQEIAATKQAFLKKGFIDDEWNLLNWQKRQPESDSSATRVQRYREKRRAMGLSSNGYTKHSETVMQRDGHACVYCESTENLCIDHVMPVNQGGTDDLPNLVTACKACNSGKAGRTPEQAGYSWANKAAEKAWLEWCNGDSNAIEQNRTDKNLSSTSLPVCPYAELLKLYARRLPELPQPRKSLWIAGADGKAMKARWRGVLTACYESGERAGQRMATNEAEALAWFDRFFEYVSRSNWLMGRDREWHCNLAWLMKLENFTTVLSGNYDNKAQA